MRWTFCRTRLGTVDNYVHRFVASKVRLPGQLPEIIFISTFSRTYLIILQSTTIRLNTSLWGTRPHTLKSRPKFIR